MNTKPCLLCGALLLATGYWLLATGRFSAGAAEVGVTDSEIRIGQFAAQSGPAAALGKRVTSTT